MRGYSGAEALGGLDVDLRSATILDFWQRAHSDLRDNSGRGMFAEWMVWKLLGLPDGWPQDHWKNCDIKAGPVRIEVKASAYVQAWHEPGHEYPDRPALIKFSSLKNRLILNPEETLVAENPTFNCDLYAFCAEIHRDPSTWDALDLGQWEFYCLKKPVLEEVNQKSMNLNTLRGLAKTHSGGPFAAGPFTERAQQMIAEIAGGLK
jgi:hypothetical protein